MTPQKSKAEVLLSFLEYRSFYREPMFEAWDRQGEVALAVFRAFREWNVTLENVYAPRQNPSDTGDIQMSVDLFSKRFTFTIGLGAASLFVNNPTWAEAELIKSVARSGVQAVRESSGAIIEKQQASLAMHLKPGDRSLRELTSEFLRLDDSHMVGDNIRAYGFAVYREDSSWVVDTSGLFPEALFVRMNRIVGAEVTFDELLSKSREDQERLLEVLGLSLD